MEKKQQKDIGSSKERRKKFSENVSITQYYHSQGKLVPCWPTGHVPPKVMSNEDRRKLNIEQDPSLPDYKEN